MSQAKRHKVARYMRAREQAGIGDGYFDLAEALVAVDRMLATGVREAERLAVELHFAAKLASQPALEARVRLGQEAWR